MLTNAQISYIFLYVRDLGAARSFYEGKLGFRVVEEDAAAVKYDAGDIMLALNRASDYGVDLTGPRDSLLVFHTGAIDPVVDRLRRDAVGVGAIDRYEIGALAEFKDPDGHNLSLYEPSTEALTWPSADKIRAIVGPPGEPGGVRGQVSGPQDRIGDCRMVYLFLFVRDAAEAAAFYGDLLGLELLEKSECSASGGGDEGVAKYDGGSIILTTHYSDTVAARAPGERRHKGLAVVFNVADIERMTDALRTAGLKFGSPISTSEIGRIIRFADPNGHSFYLHEPSVMARDWASGQKIRDLVTKYAE